MFFSKPGEYPACGLFSLGHILAVLFLLIIVVVLLLFLKNIKKETIKNIIKVSAIIFIVLEVLKIAYRFLTVGGANLNTWVPLYYCSIMIYAAFLAGFFKGKLELVGLSFLTTGGIVGGFCFLIMPTTSLPEFPLFHFLSLHSLLYHAYFLFLGLLLIRNNYFVPKLRHFGWYAVLTGIVTLVAFVVDVSYGANLMFLLKPFNLKPLEVIYNFSRILYMVLFVLIQVIAPFFVITLPLKLIEKIKQKHAKNNKNIEAN